MDLRPRYPLWVLVVAGLGSPTAAQPTEEAASRTAVIGHASNVEAFPFYRCRFKTTYGTAANEADARVARGPMKESVEALCVVDGDRELLEIFGANEATKPTAADRKAAKGGVVGVEQKGIITEKYLRNGKASGAFVMGLKSLQLGRSDDGCTGPPAAYIYSPLYTWYADRGTQMPDRMLAQPTKFTATFLGEKPGVGRNWAGIRLMEVEHGITYESWFDPERGYLPSEFALTFGRKTMCGRLAEAKEFRPGRWFPMRLVWHGPDSSDASKWTYCVIEVLELEVDKRPQERDFTTTFPAGTQVHRDGDMAFFNLKQDERLGVNDLDELFDKLERSKTEPLMDTTIEHTGDRTPWWWWAVGGAGATLILFGGWLWWRKRRAAKRAASA